MSRRVIRDAARERAEQERLQDRIGRAGMNALKKEIARESERLILGWTATGTVPQIAEHEQRLAAIVDQIHAVSIRTFSQRLEEQIKSATPANLKASGNPLYDRLVQIYISTFGGLKIAADIGRTTRSIIVRMIAKGKSSGQSNDEIAKDMRARVPQLSTARSAVISRTEVHNSSNYAILETAKETGVVTGKEWVSGTDDRVRDGEFDHLDANGQTALLNEPFIVSGEELMYPGDPSGSAGNVINCRCAQVFLVDD